MGAPPPRGRTVASRRHEQQYAARNARRRGAEVQQVSTDWSSTGSARDIHVGWSRDHPPPHVHIRPNFMHLMCCAPGGCRALSPTANGFGPLRHRRDTPASRKFCQAPRQVMARPESGRMGCAEVDPVCRCELMNVDAYEGCTSENGLFDLIRFRDFRLSRVWRRGLVACLRPTLALPKEIIVEIL